LLPFDLRRQLVDSDKFVEELPNEFGITDSELEVMMGLAMTDAIEIQTKFDELSRNYITVTHKSYVRNGSIQEAWVQNRRAWGEFLNSLFERDNYSLE
jgi:hypothetical protein